MAIPVFMASHTNGSTFATTLTGSFDVGASAATILAFASTEGGSSATVVNSISIGGQSMTALTDRSMNTELGVAGRMRGFELIGSSLTGSQSYTVTMSDGNSKPSVMFVTFSGGATATSASRAGASVTGGNTYSSTIASDTNSKAILVALCQSTGNTITATAPTTKNAQAVGFTYDYICLSEDGATSSTLEAVPTSTDAFAGVIWSLAGSAVSNNPHSRSMLLGIG